jgi:hypothetical protein
MTRVTCEMRNTHKILVGKYDEMRWLERVGIDGSNTKMNLKELEW